MSKEPGPREQQLRQMREERFGKSQATVSELRQKIAKIKPTSKRKQGKRR